MEMTELPRPTRAQVIRDKVVIRLATNEAGPQIAAVLLANGIALPGADWSKVFPHWLIATVGDDVIGCCQVVSTKPVGYVAFLFVKPRAPFKFRAIAIRKLGIQAMNTLYHFGCQYVAGTVSTRNKKFLDVVEGLNFQKVDVADLVVKRLA